MEDSFIELVKDTIAKPHKHKTDEESGIHLFFNNDAGFVIVGVECPNGDVSVAQVISLADYYIADGLMDCADAIQHATKAWKDWNE